jgi:hypothetical protein
MNLHFPVKSYTRLTAAIILAFTCLSAKAQQETNYAVHANIIYHFTKYINWPAEKKTGDFIIGVVGESRLYDELKSSTAGKTVGNQKIVIREFSPSALSFDCHILFITDGESRRIKRITSIISSTLIVSESDGMAQKGSCINFTIVHERLKLEINKNNIEKRNLDIATELLKLGTIIE